MDLVDDRQLAGLRLLPLPLPAAQLAGDVVLLAAELAEPGGVGVDGVDLDQGVDDALADRPAVVWSGKASASARPRRTGPSTNSIT